jgi:hypothetical protein
MEEVQEGTLVLTIDTVRRDNSRWVFPGQPFGLVAMVYRATKCGDEDGQYKGPRLDPGNLYRPLTYMPDHQSECRAPTRSGKVRLVSALHHDERLVICKKWRLVPVHNSFARGLQGVGDLFDRAAGVDMAAMAVACATSNNKPFFLYYTHDVVWDCTPRNDIQGPHSYNSAGAWRLGSVSLELDAPSRMQNHYNASWFDDISSATMTEPVKPWLPPPWYRVSGKFVAVAQPYRQFRQFRLPSPPPQEAPPPTPQAPPPALLAPVQPVASVWAIQEACDAIALMIPIRDLVWITCTYLIENRVVIPVARHVCRAEVVAKAIRNATRFL